MSGQGRVSPSTGYGGMGVAGHNGPVGVGGASPGTEGLATRNELPVQPQPPVKMLCKTPGCSFYPMHEFHGYCKNCYTPKQ